MVDLYHLVLAAVIISLFALVGLLFFNIGNMNIRIKNLEKAHKNKSSDQLN